MFGVLEGAEEGVSGGRARPCSASVALSKAKKDIAATGANPFCSSANDASMLACSVLS